MPKDLDQRISSGPLAGARIWLSGAVPDVNESTEEERSGILKFVRDFANKIFRLGGHIIHGSHPSFTPTLLEEAEKYLEGGGKKDCLSLVVSRHWSKDSGRIPINEWRRKCVVYETPEVTGEQARNRSIELLRNWIAARCDAMIAVGGRWWQEVSGRAGVPQEVELSVQRALPCFLLGGLGGVAGHYLETHPELLNRLKNGLDRGTNKAIATESDIPSLTQKICDQLLRLPLVHGRGSDGSSFRILALDGGGIRGAFTAAALATWEENTGMRAVDHFDLIAGTSTGGILAIGLGVELSAKEMLQFYRTRGPVIFPLTSFSRRLKYGLKHLFRPKFSQEVLLDELEKAYYRGGAAITFAESKCRLLIPAYHAIAGASHVFRTPHNPLLTGDANTPAAYAALATAAAPTYFSAAKVGNMIAESNFFDGGVWANSPAMAAIVEATCFLKVPLDRIDILSVGTTDEPFTVRRQARSGIFGWSTKLVRLLMSVQGESSLKSAELIAGKPRFLRVNVMTIPGSYRLDSPTEIEELASLGNRQADDPEILAQVRSRFLNGVNVNPWERFP
jgi:uncharacterized protein